MEIKVKHLGYKGSEKESGESDEEQAQYLIYMCMQNFKNF